MIEGLCAAVAGEVAAAGVEGARVGACSALACAEPVAVLWVGFEREARFDGEERGVAAVDVLCVREADADAAAAAEASEEAVRSAHWAEWNDALPGARALGVDTDAPEPRGRDASGRYVWGFRARVTVAREV